MHTIVRFTLVEAGTLRSELYIARVYLCVSQRKLHQLVYAPALLTTSGTSCEQLVELT